MDSLTQLTLGAAVGEAVLGRRVGRRAALWGAVCGTLPDLDVFIPLDNAVAEFTYHRSYSHSLFVLAALTPLIVWLIRRLHPAAADPRRGWYALVMLTFATHVLLDCLTVYGTQIFWPFWSVPVGWGSVFIVDPAYTVPLLLGVLAALILRRRPGFGHRLNIAGLALSTLYLGWGVGAKLYVDDLAGDALAEQGIAHERYMVMAAPMTTLLWRIVAVGDGAYYEGFHSLLGDDGSIRFARYPRAPTLLDGLGDHWPVQRLRWFTKGYYSVERRGKSVVMTDLRMGLEPDYVFRFQVGRLGNPHAYPVSARRVPSNRSGLDVRERLWWVWNRIWSEDLASATGVSRDPGASAGRAQP